LKPQTTAIIETANRNSDCRWSFIIMIISWIINFMILKSYQH